MQTQHDFAGVNVAVLTPLQEDLSPDISKMASYAKWLLANGANGLAVLGTTGEANSFSVRERILIIEGLASAGIDPRSMMPGTGACSLTDAVEGTAAAVQVGCKGVLMLPPFYYKNPSDDGLFAYFSETIQRVGSEDLRIYLYHFPQMSTVPISFRLIERLLKEYPKIIAGMKDSSGDLNNMIDAAERFPGFSVFAGSEACFLPLLRKGGAGCITACSNVSSRLAQEVYSGFLSGQDDAHANSLLCSVRETIEKYPLASALKTIIADTYQDKEWLRIRAPLVPIKDGDRKQLIHKLKEIGLNFSIAA